MTPQQPDILLLSGAAQVATCAGDDAGVIANGVVAVSGENILAVGTRSEVQSAIAGRVVREIDVQGGCIIPGYVDCHTHLVFAGDRSQEYFARAQGMSETAMQAAGIPFDVPASVKANRGLSVEALVAATLPRLRRMLASGTTTLETKSGYGLDPQSDLRSLQAARRLAELVPVEIVGSYLGAHALPPGAVKDRFLDEVIDEGIPRMADEKLAEFCDVYCDPMVFDLRETERVLRKAHDCGMKLKLHVDAKNNIGGTRLAAEMRAVSVDHVNYTTAEDFRALADAGTIAVAFPGFDYVVGHPAPVDMRVVRDSGVELALGTDLCPVCWLESMQVAGTFGCRANHMTPAEALRAATIIAAKAINRSDRIGSLEPGKQADIVVLDVAAYQQTFFRFGVNTVRYVIKKGKVVVDQTAGQDRQREDTA